MKKQDLKSGMYIEFECGKRSVILLNTESGDIMSDVKTENCHYGEFDRLFNFYELNNLTEDLKEVDNRGIIGNVVKIYSHYAKLIWERPEENIFLKGNIVKNNKREILITKDGDNTHFGGVVLEDVNGTGRGDHSNGWTIIKNNNHDFYGDKYKKINL